MKAISAEAEPRQADRRVAAATTRSNAVRAACGVATLLEQQPAQVGPAPLAGLDALPPPRRRRWPPSGAGWRDTSRPAPRARRPRASARAAASASVICVATAAGRPATSSAGSRAASRRSTSAPPASQAAAATAATSARPQSGTPPIERGALHWFVHRVRRDNRSYGQLMCMPPVTRSGRPSPVRSPTARVTRWVGALARSRRVNRGPPVVLEPHQALRRRDWPSCCTH